MILSHIQVKPLLTLERTTPQIVSISTDLGRQTVEHQLDAAGLHLGPNLVVAWADLEAIAADENGTFLIEPVEPDEDSGSAAVKKIRFYSDFTQRAYTLYPTTSAPTMLVSGITMHRIVDCDPWEDTRHKIRALGRLPTGYVLDTCMGLGYTAIQAAETAHHVDTIELDPTVVEVCRLNPWSAPLFGRENITRHVGHVWDVLEDEMPDGRFQVILHDPPMFNMAGELYSADFYRELLRVLQRGGVLYHYIGNPDSRSGANVTRGVVRRLKEVGFKKVKGHARSFGVVAMK